ncbi:unnamed protein product [Notodromas monacha]|uniref:SKP1 component dimerisation domain-containing protein n=1 Tax=Notodromas monacha TaxID=399045 RepID=A0A7R9BRK0_9CRUS|nr:unnamed protein product [Notodromas monacha]CAG0919452.1 unnamed protein product [Notodromas monacha]
MSQQSSGATTEDKGVSVTLMPSIMIETTENQILEVGMYPLVKHSPVIRKMLYTYCSNPQLLDPVLRLDPGFDTPTLLKVIEWCDHYRDWDPSVPMELSEISDWDAQFLKMDMKALLEVVKASYYLEIDGLGDVTCHGLAQLMEGKSPQQLREMFNIVNDFRSDEEVIARACLEARASACLHARMSTSSKQSRKQARAAARSKQASSQSSSSTSSKVADDSYSR